MTGTVVAFTVRVDAQVAADAGDLCRYEPPPLCGAKSPKGNWRCCRAPHPADTFCVGVPKERLT